MQAKIIAHTDADEATLILPDGSEMKAAAADGIATFDLENALQGRYAVTVAGAKDAKTVYFQAMGFTDAFRHGITSNNTNGDEHPIFGFTSRVDADALEMYADGVKLETSTNESTTDGWVLDYGAKVETSVSYDVLTLKHLKLAALPGYTMEVSFDKALYQTLEPAGSSSDDARERPSWAPSDSTISANPIWPIYPNTLADDGNRAPLAPTPTAFDTEITVSALDAAAGTFTVSFSEPVNRNEFGIAMDFAQDWTLAWDEAAQSVTVTVSDGLAAGQTGNVVIFRLRDMENNMIGENGIAGPVCRQITAE